MLVRTARSGSEVAISASGTALSDAEGAVLGEMLKASEALEELSLNRCSCSGVCLQSIAEGLAASKAPLKILNVDKLKHGHGAEPLSERTD